MKNVRLLIVDELSMVSSVTLAKINLRLQVAYCILTGKNKAFFRKYSILVKNSVE